MPPSSDIPQSPDPTPAPLPAPASGKQRTLVRVALGVIVAMIVLVGAGLFVAWSFNSSSNLNFSGLHDFNFGFVPGSNPTATTTGTGSITEEVSYVDNRTPWQAIMDYFIQDVCLDKNGNVMMGVSPVDGNPNCVAHRDLLPGERLPYHKENPRDNGDTDRLDEMPVETGTSLGVVAVKFKDNYGKGTDKPNVLDIGDGINNIYVQSATAIGTFATIDSNGPTFRISSACSDARGGVPNDLQGLLNAQVRVTIDALTQQSGTETTSFAKVYNPGACPAAGDYKTDQNAWKIASYSYERPDGTKTPPLKTLVSNSVTSDDNHHFERYYQTKELGRTRFEAWQNTAGMDAATKASYEKNAAQLAKAGGDCASPFEPPPTNSGAWVMYQCGEWTTVSPPSDMQNGDYPDQFVNALKTGNMTAVLFGLKPTDNPTITSVTPSTFTDGTPTTLTIAGNFAPHDAQGQVIVMVDGGGVHGYATPTNGNTQVTFDIPWDRNAQQHTLNPGSHILHVFDGVSMSNPLTFTVTKSGGGGKKNN